MEGYEEEALSKQESFGSQQQLLQEREQDSQDASQFESILLQDLEHSESESEEDDFPFGDGDDEEEEDIEEEPMNFSPGADENSNDNSMNTETGNLSGEDI